MIQSFPISTHFARIYIFQMDSVWLVKNNSTQLNQPQRIVVVVKTVVVCLKKLITGNELEVRRLGWKCFFSFNEDTKKKKTGKKTRRAKGWQVFWLVLVLFCWFSWMDGMLMLWLVGLLEDVCFFVVAWGGCGNVV